MITIPYHNYYPHQWDFAKECVFGDKKQAYIQWCRRSGKDDIFINVLCVKIMERVGVYFYLLPQKEQVRKTVWENIGQDGVKFIDYFPKELVAKYRSNDMTIVFKNGSILKFVGSDNYKTIRGPNPVGIIQAEYQDHKAHANSDLLPIILQNNGFMWKNGVHPETKNHAYRMWDSMSKDDTCFTSRQTWHTAKNDKGKFLYSEKMKEDARKVMGQGEIDCNFEMRLPLQSEKYIYSTLLNQLYEQGQILDFKIDTRLPVAWFFDLGCSSVEASLCCWGVQVANDKFYVICAMAYIGQGIDVALDDIAEFSTKNMLRSTLFVVPHDGQHRKDYMDGKNIISKCSDRGIKLTLGGSVQSVKSGISNTKDIMPMCIFHKTNCGDGLDALENYQRTYNVNLDIYGSPLHDWASHYADGFRYFGQYYSKKAFNLNETIIQKLDREHNAYIENQYKRQGINKFRKAP